MRVEDATKLNEQGRDLAAKCYAYADVWETPNHDPLAFAAALFDLRAAVTAMHEQMLAARPPLEIRFDVEGLCEAMADPRFDDWRDSQDRDAYEHLRAMVGHTDASDIWRDACNLFDARHASD